MYSIKRAKNVLFKPLRGVLTFTVKTLKVQLYEKFTSWGKKKKYKFWLWQGDMSWILYNESNTDPV